LLTFSKETPFALEPIDLNALVREGLELVRVPFKDAEVTLDPPLATVTMDQHIDEQVFNDALAKVGAYRMEMDMHAHDHQAAHRSPGKNEDERGHHDHGKQQAHAEHTGHEMDDNPPHGHAGHDHHRMMIEDFKKRFWVSLVLAVPILVLSPMIQHWAGFSLQFTGSSYVLFALASVVYFYGGWPFIKGFVSELKKRAPGMMTLIAMAISVAFLYSAATTFGLPGEDFFWELATLIVIMLLGHWIEMRSVLGASRALELLVSMMPAEAHKIVRDEIHDVKLEEILSGDLILVKPGEKVPADGVVVDGESYLNEAMLTGESKPVRKGKHDQVIGGSINGNSTLKVQVEHTGKDSYLNKVVTMVREAQKTKSRMQNLSDRAAKWLTYIALAIGFGTLALWLILGHNFVFALERMVTVMVISCPHALGLAVPLVVAISTSVSAQHGLLIRNRTAFEESRKISALVFDKTGTLTEGEFGVTRVEVVDTTVSEDRMMQLAGSLDQSSEHPIAVGVMDEV
ncbi:MAG: HAD-IC family P-type ATPase, partial [Saprospiraceae bacterium]|nr:HAD-IC family P-type ATPase [Saprospiraceae bacterium]